MRRALDRVDLLGLDASHLGDLLSVRLAAERHDQAALVRDLRLGLAVMEPRHLDAGAVTRPRTATRQRWHDTEDLSFVTRQSIGGEK